jgi:hypothetical protein
MYANVAEKGRDATRHHTTRIRLKSQKCSQLSLVLHWQSSRDGQASVARYLEEKEMSISPQNFINSAPFHNNEIGELSCHSSDPFT